MQQSQPWQQSGFSEMQLLQQQVMFKQMQEMQSQQQFQSFTDSRQHLGILKNADGAQYSPIINGTPVHGNSNTFTNWGQQSVSPSFQGMSQLTTAQDHRSACGDGVQQFDGSSYEFPMPSAGSGMNQIYLPGISSVSPLQRQQGFSHSFSGGQNTDSSNQPFSLRQDCLRSNFYGQVLQKTNENSPSGSFEHASVLPKNTMAFVINEKEQSGWPSNQLDNNSMHISPSQGSATLDPLEEKILFSMDDNLWDISSGKCTKAGTGNTGNALGSWSALMQTALGETSSSETGLQEEWSGLTFQNTDPSADNQTSNLVESGHQQIECIENSIQPASALSVTEYQYLNSPDMNFPGFHQAITHNQSEQDRLLHSSPEHNQVFSQSGGRFENNHQQFSKPQSQTMTQAKHGWTSPGHGREESTPSQLQFTSADQRTNNTNFWSEQKGQSGTSSSLVQNNARINSFSSEQNSLTSLVNTETQNQENNHLGYAYTTNTADAIRDGVRMVNHHVPNHSPQAFHGSSSQLNSNATKLSINGRLESDVSNAVSNAMLFHASNLGSQRSQNVLQLFQNISQSRVEGPLVHSSPISQGQKTCEASEAQYNSQSSMQGSSLPPSPSQRYLNHNSMQASSQNSWQNAFTPESSSSVPNQSQLQWQQISRSGVGSQPIRTALYSAANRYANAIASSQQNSPGSTNANPFAQQYTAHGVHSTYQPAMASNLSQQDVFSSKPINQWTDVPVQKHSVGNKSELVHDSRSSDKHVEEMIGHPQNFNEQETENVMPSGPYAQPVIKYKEEKSQPRMLSEAQPESEVQELSEIQDGHLEKNSPMNQMNILFGNLEDTVWSTDSLAITRPNKRKSRTSELLPWHKEVEKLSISFTGTRTCEQEWAQATNQLMEVANEAELLKFGQGIVRPRKRLILTTRLMQRLLHPAPRTIFSIDAASEYESVAYIVARLSLGDACTMSLGRAKTNSVNKTDRQEKSNLDRVVENFSKRITRLEDVLQRSEGIPSIVDLNVEYMDLERFAVINRFAKFHSRPQPNPSDTLSSGPPKMYPQRYVSAFPMPKEIPDGLHCISL